MKITENEMRGLIRGQCLPADILFGESLASYLVRKFDEHQQKLDALAAENMALKDYLKECSVVQGEGNWTTDAEKSVYVPATEWMPQTPVTDAWLNSVRAEGAIAVRNALVVSDDGSYIYAVANEVIVQLRAGKKSEGRDDNAAEA